MYAGGYALSPSFPVLPGHLLVRVDASASAAGPDFNVILSDASHNEVTGAVTAVSSTGFQVTTAWIPVPTGVANVSVRLENQTPDTTLEVRSVSIQWQP